MAALLARLSICNIASGLLHALGDSKRPLYTLIVCCLINVILDLAFILIFDMGIAGAQLLLGLPAGLQYAMYSISNMII